MSPQRETGSVSTIEQKQQELKSKREAERQLGAKIDRQIQNAEQRGCGFCSLFGLRRRRPEPGASEFFGTPKKSDPNAALATAVQAMQQRVEQLEGRVAETRAEAQRLASKGDKPAAMRALKRAKTLERQLAATQASMDAVEQQQDMLEQAYMQRAVATALSSTSKGMKKDKKLLARAEASIEDAHEARGIAEDLGSVMLELAPPPEDEDELMQELEQMMQQTPPEPPPKEEEIAHLERKIEQHEAAAMVRRALPVPGNHQPKLEEKQMLLAVS